MEKLVNFEVDKLEKIDFDNYSNEEFAIARMGFLSTKPNSHELKISEEVLRNCAKTVLDKWVVADMQFGEPTTHTKNEHIVGKIPKEQSIEFVYDENNYLRAYVDTVISKIYAKDFCEAFAVDTSRAVSVEMKVEVSETDKDEVVSFNIVGVTVLGKTIFPSCPDSDINMIRFSQEDADAYFSKIHEHNLTPLKKFAKERKDNMAENKSYKVDKSKESMSEKAWGEVDKTDLRDKIMEASNRDALVKSVYMLVEEGWQNAPSEHLKYPVMCFDGDKLVYNRYGLASALAYAKQENETAVIKKIERIYKKLDIDNSDRKEDGVEKMSKEIEFAAVAIGDMWDNLWKILCEKHPGPDGYGSIYHIENIYEDNGQKFAIIVDDCCKYRLDFYLTEDGLTTSDEIVKVETEIVETDEVKRFAEPDDVEKYRNGDKHEDEDDDDDDEEKDDDEEDVEEKMARLEKEIAEKDHIIMEKDGELEELRKFKQSVMESERAKTVESVMEEVKEYIDTESYNNLRNEGLMCEFSEIDAWTNKAKAMCFGAVKKSRQSAKENSNIWSFSAPTEIQHKKNSIWD